MAFYFVKDDNDSGFTLCLLLGYGMAESARQRRELQKVFLEELNMLPAVRKGFNLEIISVLLKTLDRFAIRHKTID